MRHFTISSCYQKSRFQIDSYHEHHQIGGKFLHLSIHMLYSVQRGEELLDKEKVTNKEGAYPHGIYIYIYIKYIYM